MPERFFDKNVGGTLNLLRAAQTLSIKRMLYTAPAEVYGEAPSPKCDEKTELNPVNTCAVSKAAADRLCHTYYLEHGVPVVIARIFNCYRTALNRTLRDSRDHRAAASRPAGRVEDRSRLLSTASLARVSS
jgi:nucleoside-diphosphate-sugar epimerase